MMQNAWSGEALEPLGGYTKERDRLLPIANVSKLMARELSHIGHAKISASAKNLMQEYVSEFICFIMSEANDKALAAKRKAVSEHDMIAACRDLGARRAARRPISRAAFVRIARALLLS